MRSASERDQQTVTIGTALAIFVGTLALGLALVAVVGSTTGLVQISDSTFRWVALVAVAACVLHLARHRRT